MNGRSVSEPATSAETSPGNQTPAVGQRVPKQRPAIWVRAINGLSVALAVPAALAVVIMMLQIIVDVTGRTFFDHPLKGTLEMTQHWWMLTIVFGALGYAELRRDHMRATVIVDLLPYRWRQAGEVFAAVLLGVVALFMMYYGWSAAQQSREIREASNGTPPIPIWPFIFAVPAGCLALALQCISTIYQVMMTKDATPDDAHIIDEAGTVF